MAWSKTAFVGIGAIFAFVAASCANTGTNPTTDAGADVVVGPCGPGTAVKCGDTCVDPQTNAQNCGGCNKACPQDQVCSHGTCATVCATGTAHCGNDCVDLASDVNNCGGCGKPCPSGNVCNKGSCALTCQDGLTNCNGDCVDVTQNDDNCGSCGSPCAGGQHCVNSQCVATCQTGWTTCANDAGGTCVDTQHDPQNCGSCGAACPSGQFCSPVNNVGTCGIQCMGGTSLCSGKCVDETIDPNNCGGCNAVCSGTCSAGHCCGTGQVYCGACDTIANCTVKTGGALTAGSSHTCAINSSGILKCWGYGADGELGDGNATPSKVPVMPSLVGSAIFVGAGASHTCAIVAGGKAYCWGLGFDGQIGDGGGTERDSPSEVSNLTGAVRIDGGESHSCAILSGGSVMCWGANFFGEVGNNAPGIQENSPVSTNPAITDAIEINAGLGYHACALSSTGYVKCWGESDYGECGDNNPNNFEDDSPTDVVDSSNTKFGGVSHIALGYQHTCAIVSGNVWCWGDDTYGELGDGNTGTMSYVPVQATNVSGATALAAGGNGGSAHTCALIGSTGAVVCWGSNDYGQLGDGSTTSSLTPVTAIASGAVAIAAGAIHTCAMKNDGTVWCWGDNSAGQLGDGTTTQQNSPVQVQGF